MRLRMLGDQTRQGGFSSSGRAGEEDGRKEPVGDDGAAQQFAFADYVFLTNEFIQCARAQPGCQRRFVLQVLIKRVVK